MRGRGQRWGCGAGAGVLLVLTALAAGPARAGHRDPRFVNLTKEQGLSDNTVEAIVEDRRGFMWFGTADGLNRYDAHSFAVYRHDPEDPRSLGGNFVNALFVDRDGELWVATNNGLNRYQRDSDSFVRYRHDPNDPTSLSHNAVFALHQDPRGNLWAGTLAGLDRLDRDPAAAASDRESGTFVRFTPPGGDARRLADVRAILRALRAPRPRGRGHRHRPGGGAAHRRGPRRPDLGRVGGRGARLDLPLHLAAGPARMNASDGFYFGSKRRPFSRSKTLHP